MKPLKSVLLLIACGGFAMLPAASAAEQEVVLQRITKLAHANDLMSEEQQSEVQDLRSSADRIFPELSEIIAKSDDDRVLNMALSIASAAPDTRRKELAGVASGILLEKKAAAFPLVTQRALTTLGEAGEKQYLPLVKSFASSPELLIRTAADSAAADLEGKQTNSSDPAAGSPRPKSGADTGAEDLQNNTGSKERSGPMTGWLPVAGLVSVALLLLWMLGKARK